MTGDLPLLGFGLPVSGSWATPDDDASHSPVAPRSSGYASLWTFQRVLYPVPTGPALRPVAPRAVRPDLRAVHPSAAAYVAGHTDRIGLGTATICAPFTAPALLAKATDDAGRAVSGGRLTAGLGIGWMPEEYAAAGVPFERRGARMDEYLRCLEALWTQDPVEFAGEFYTVPRSHVGPPPVQRPHPPVLRRRRRRAGAAPRRAARPGLDQQHPAGPHAARPRPSRRCATARARPGATRTPCGSSCAASSTWSTTTPAAAPPLHGTREQVLDDLAGLRAQGVTEVFVDLNFSPRVGSPDVDADAATARPSACSTPSRPRLSAAPRYAASTFGMISSLRRLRSSSVLETGTSANGGHSSGIVSPASL